MENEETIGQGRASGGLSPPRWIESLLPWRTWTERGYKAHYRCWRPWGAEEGEGLGRGQGGC